MSIVIVDYGMGNLGAVHNMIRKVGGTSIITDNPEHILNATKIILPGVGSFDEAMKNLNERKFIDILNKKKNEGIPIMGICLGCQLLTESSEEGQLTGLGWIKGKTLRFPESHLKIPHMGWNYVIQKRHPILEGLPEPSRFYFAHSYYIQCPNENVIAECDYGIRFAAGIQKDNVYGFQFHPEKSHNFGKILMSNFVRL
jgi:imidazole glycerol-phosphate synthase subunit HisH